VALTPLLYMVDDQPLLANGAARYGVRTHTSKRLLLVLYQWEERKRDCNHQTGAFSLRVANAFHGMQGHGGSISLRALAEPGRAENPRSVLKLEMPSAVRCAFFTDMPYEATQHPEIHLSRELNRKACEKFPASSETNSSDDEYGGQKLNRRTISATHRGGAIILSGLSSVTHYCYNWYLDLSQFHLIGAE
jgi:hypothetical protein